MSSRSLALVVALGAGCAHVSGPPLDAVSGLRALPGPTATGETFNSRSLEGKVVVVAFITTWCFPCLADMPVLDRLQRDHGPEGLQVVLVGLDREAFRVLEPFARTYDFPFPVLWGRDEVREGRSVFGPLRELPARFVFARDGSLKLGYSGVADPKKFIEAVKAQLH